MCQARNGNNLASASSPVSLRDSVISNSASSSLTEIHATIGEISLELTRTLSEGGAPLSSSKARATFNCAMAIGVFGQLLEVDWALTVFDFVNKDMHLLF